MSHETPIHENKSESAGTHDGGRKVLPNTELCKKEAQGGAELLWLVLSARGQEIRGVQDWSQAMSIFDIFKRKKRKPVDGWRWWGGVTTIAADPDAEYRPTNERVVVERADNYTIVFAGPESMQNALQVSVDNQVRYVPMCSSTGTSISFEEYAARGETLWEERVEDRTRCRYCGSYKPGPEECPKCGAP